MPDLKKKDVAEAALRYVCDGCNIGIGTGSTVNFFIESLTRSGKKLGSIVTTSAQSEQLLKKGGLFATPLGEVSEPLDVYIDGADEVDPRLNLIKGGGGALTSEKIVANNAKKFICIVDESKLVQRLGKFPLPVEVISSAVPSISSILKNDYNARPLEREGYTEHGNRIIDVAGLEIKSPEKLEGELNQIPGVVTVGLFCKLKPYSCLVGYDMEVKEIFKKDATNK